MLEALAWLVMMLIAYGEPAWAAGPGRPTPPSGLTLSEAYQATLRRSEALGMQEQLLVQADELERQAKSAFFPAISASATLLRQDAPAASTAKVQNTVKITGTQPLFRGFRDFALLRQRAAVSEQQRAAVRDAARQLFYDVADAYYGTLVLEADERNYGIELDVNRRRLKDLEGFRRVGRSRASEVLTQRANIASLEAQLESTRGQLRMQREILAFLTGLPTHTVLRDVEPFPSGSVPMEAYLGGLGKRPDLLASQAALRGAEEAVSATRGLYWPTADMTANYYLERTGVNPKWDISLVVTLSLFQGGAVRSQVRQALSVQEQSTLQLERARRLADEEVRRFFASVTSGEAQLRKLGDFVSLSRQNYLAQQRDYRNGLVTNLEVLQSISSWQVALRTQERQQLALKSSFVKLQAAGGRRAEIAPEAVLE